MPVLLPRGLLDDVHVAARNDATKARYRRVDAIETDWVMTYWVKGSSGLSIVDRSLEAPLDAQDGYLTPNERFFVCNSGTTPIVDAERHIVRVQGDGVANELELSIADLEAMPQRTVAVVLECAGNHRFLFREVAGETLDKRPQVTELMWGLGAVGMAQWRGVPLRHILGLAGLDPEAVHVCPRGAEIDSREGEIRMPVPVSKAMDPDTILALEMNGEPLPPDHGFPVRMIVPGWIGAYSVKWVREIEVSRNHLKVMRNTEFYVLRGNGWPAGGVLITELNLKSSLALAWPARLAAGDHILHGYARGSTAPIDSVHWSDDKGSTWQVAELTGPDEPYGWVRFQFRWRAVAGHYTLMTRATDRHGKTQPASVPFNDGGYLYNAVHPHPVTVE